MRRYWPLIILLAACTGFVQASGITLAKNQTALLPIIISAKASKETQEVAALLSGYLEKMSGAKFAVKTGDGKTGIVLGTLAEFPNPALAKPLEIRNIYDGREAYAIRTEAKRLLLIGATEKGVSHAAFRLLEELGCRRFFPTPEWEVIPLLKTISVHLTMNDRPAMLYRRTWAGMGYWTGKEAEYKLWQRFNRLDQSFTVFAGHAQPAVYLAHKEEFDAHPEYFALVNGQRNTDWVSTQLCMSNPTVRKWVVEWALNYLKTNPDQDMVSVDPNDGGNYCECENCKKLGTLPDQVFGLANEVAREVAKQYPGKMVGVLAYSTHSEPPSFPLEPNVYIQLTHGYNFGKYSFDDLLALWSKKAKNFGIYEYYSVWGWDYERPPLGLGADVMAIQKYTQQAVKAGANSLDSESSTDWGPYGRGYYIANRLKWNPYADVPALLKDFYEKAFGPAAAPMQSWYERFDPANQVFITEDALGRAYRDLAKAAELAKDRPDVQLRIDRLKQYMQYVRLRWHFDQETDAAKKKQEIFEILRHVSRLQETQLLYSWALLRGWTTGLAIEYNEPTWNYFEPTQPKPYATEKLYTHEETEKLFQEGLAEFKLVDLLPEKSFSADLLPVRFTTNAPATMTHLSMFGMRYVFYTVKDAPLLVDITTGTSFTDLPALIYTVTDAANKVILQDRLPQDKQKHRIEINTPKPGRYFLSLTTSAGYYLQSASECPLVIALTREQYTCGTIQPLYFYVPKGTAKFQYFCTIGVPHDVLGPDGAVVQHVDGKSQYITVTVPPGMDGKPWCMRGFYLGYLCFRNLPNYVAASPNGLMVPRELVKSDRLQSPTLLTNQSADTTKGK